MSTANFAVSQRQTYQQLTADARLLVFTVSDRLRAVMEARRVLPQRVRTLLAARGQKPADVARAVGKSPSWASLVLAGKRDIPLLMVDAVARFLEVEPWRLLIDDTALEALEARSLSIEGFSPVRWLKSPIAAGEPLAMADAADEDPRYLAFQDRFLRHFSSPLCLTVGPREQSMLPTIQPSDVVVIDQALDARTNPTSGHIYAVNLAGLTGETGGTLKRIEVSDDHLVVIADNQDKTRYRTRAFDLEGIVLPQVLVGRVVWIGRTIGDRRIKK